MITYTLAQYQPIIDLILTFVDGLIFGVAIKKGILSFILAVVGVIIGSYIGITLPGLSLQLLITKAVTLASYLLSKAPLQLSSFPILFILGLAIGLWKG